MKAFVTGSTGLLGSNLVALLQAQGHPVKALARSRAKAQKQFGPEGVEIIQGDMEAVSQFAPALAGCEVLFHTAAYFREYFGPGNHWEKLDRINIAGTLELLEAAERAGVKKVIYVSSSGIIGRRADGQPSDETTPPDQAAETNLYFKSKVLADRAITDWQKTHSLEVVHILPTWMFGPRDAAPTTAGRMVLELLHQRMPALVPGGNVVVDARDVAQAMMTAVEKGRNGERYVLNSGYQSIASIAHQLAMVSGVPAPSLRLSYPAALAVAWVMESLARLQGQETLMTVSGLRTLNQPLEISAAKAAQELGATFRPFSETLRDMVAWYQSHGFVAKTSPLQSAVAGT